VVVEDVAVLLPRRRLYVRCPGVQSEWLRDKSANIICFSASRFFAVPDTFPGPEMSPDAVSKKSATFSALIVDTDGNHKPGPLNQQSESLHHPLCSTNRRLISDSETSIPVDDFSTTRLDGQLDLGQMRDPALSRLFVRFESDLPLSMGELLEGELVLVPRVEVAKKPRLLRARDPLAADERVVCAHVAAHV
jgi:hypothetical protein